MNEHEMTITHRQKANIAAAKLLGLDVVDDMEIISDHACVPLRLDNEAYGFFDIFTNPADCLAVVKKLGECMIFLKHTYYAEWFFCGIDGESTDYNTYEEAVAAACLEIGDKDE